MYVLAFSSSSLLSFAKLVFLYDERVRFVQHFYERETVSFIGLISNFSTNFPVVLIANGNLGYLYGFALLVCFKFNGTKFK